MEKLNGSIGEYCTEIRGKGLMIGIEFKNPIGKQVTSRLADKKYLVGAVGDSVLRIVPPLIITKSDVDEFVNVIAESVARLREMSPLWNQELDYDGVMCKKHGDDCRKC